MMMVLNITGINFGDPLGPFYQGGFLSRLYVLFLLAVFLPLAFAGGITMVFSRRAGWIMAFVALAANSVVIIIKILDVVTGYFNPVGLIQPLVGAGLVTLWLIYFIRFRRKYRVGYGAEQSVDN